MSSGITSVVVRAESQDDAEFAARTWAEDLKDLAMPIEVVYVDVKGKARMVGTTDTFWIAEIHWVS